MTDTTALWGTPVKPGNAFTAAELRSIASRARGAAKPLAGTGAGFDLDSLAYAAERVAKALEG